MVCSYKIILLLKVYFSVETSQYVIRKHNKGSFTGENKTEIYGYTMVSLVKGEQNAKHINNLRSSN
jgi:hypothetical protein